MALAVRVLTGMTAMIWLPPAAWLYVQAAVPLAGKSCSWLPLGGHPSIVKVPLGSAMPAPHRLMSAQARCGSISCPGPGGWSTLSTQASPLLLLPVAAAGTVPARATLAPAPAKTAPHLIHLGFMSVHLLGSRVSLPTPWLSRKYGEKDSKMFHQYDNVKRAKHSTARPGTHRGTADCRRARRREVR